MHISATKGLWIEAKQKKAQVAWTRGASSLFNNHLLMKTYLGDSGRDSLASSEKQPYKATVKAAYYDPCWSFLFGGDIWLHYSCKWGWEMDVRVKQASDFHPGDRCCVRRKTKSKRSVILTC